MSKILPILIGFNSRQLRRRRIYHRIINTDQEADEWLKKIAINHFRIYLNEDVIEKIEEKMFYGYIFYTRHEIDKLEKLYHNRKSIRLIQIDTQFDIEEYLSKCKINWYPGDITRVKIKPHPTTIESLFRWGVVVPSPEVLGIWKVLYQYLINSEIEEDLVAVITSDVCNRLPPSTFMLDNQENIWFYQHHFWLATNNLAKFTMLLFNYYGQYKFWSNQRVFPGYSSYYQQSSHNFLNPEIQLREHLFHYSDFITTNLQSLDFHITKKVVLVSDEKLQLTNELEQLGLSVHSTTYDKYVSSPCPTIWCGKYYQAIRKLRKGQNIYVDIDQSGRRNKIFKITISKYLEQKDLPKEIDIVILSPRTYIDDANRAKIVVAYDRQSAEKAQLAGALVVARDIKWTVPISSKLPLQLRYLMDHYSDYREIIEEGQRYMSQFTAESVANRIKHFV